jgi:hypothetical protein
MKILFEPHGMLAGFDLWRHENLILSPPIAQPKEIYLATPALLVLPGQRRPERSVVPKCSRRGTWNTANTCWVERCRL